MKVKGILGITLAATVLTGCSTTGRKVDQAQVDTIQVGDTKADVQAPIGAPDQVGRSISGGDNWIYSYSRSRPNAKRFIPLFGTFIGGKNVEAQTITVMFDSFGRVSDVTSAYTATDAKGRPVTTTSGAATSTTTTTTPTTIP